MNYNQIVNIVKTLKKTELVFDDGSTLTVGKSDVEIQDVLGTSDQLISIYPQIREREYRILYSSATLDKHGTTTATGLREFWETNNFFFDASASVISDGRVEFRSDLPITIGFPAAGAIYIVEKPTTILFGAYTTYQSGFYIKDNDTGSLSDWRRLNIKNKFTDSEFAIVKSSDQDKQASFSAALLTANRTFTFQDKDGVIDLQAPNVVDVTSLSNFPAPVGGYIPLSDNTIYFIHGVVDIGANGLDCGTGRFIKLQGNFASIDTIISSKSGDFIIGASANVNILQLTIINNTCTNFFNVNGGGFQIFIINSCIIIGLNNIGTMDAFGILLWQGLLFQNFTDGVVFTGNTPGVSLREIQFVNCTGTYLDLNGATFDTFEISSMICNVPVGSIGITVDTLGANINTGGEGIITGTNIITSSGGIAITGYSPLDLAWNVYGNSESIITSDRIIPTGWGNYRDGITAPATQLITTTPQILQIDGLGTSTNTAYLPKSIRGTGQLWDVVNDKMTPITEGDSYDVRLDLEITAKSGGVTEIVVTLDIGVGPGITVPVVVTDVVISKTPPFTKSVNMLVFTLATFVANGGKFYVKTDVGTATISSRGVVISRNSSGAS
jgi:hypothetical protein